MTPTIDRPSGYSSLGSWLSVLGASLALFSTVGLVNAFGVFQEVFRTLLKGSSDSDISWIGSTAIALMFALSPIAGIIVDKYGPTSPLCAGSIAELLAIFMASLGEKYFEILLAQGVFLGISMAFVTNPALTVVSRRVPHRRGLAFGLTIGGSSIGGIVWPIMLQQLLYRHDVSFAWTMRIVGFVAMGPLLFACLTVRNAPIRPKKHEHTSGTDKKSTLTDQTKDMTVKEEPLSKISRFSLLKKPAFILLCAGLALTYLGLLTPLFYIPAYAVQHGISSNLASALLSILNAASFLGRILPGLLADKYGHYNLVIIAAVLSGITAFCWTKASHTASLIIFSLCYGLLSGGVMSLQAACAAKLATIENQGVAIGCTLGSVSITALVGTPIAGQILKTSGFLGLSLYTGAFLSAGAFVLALSKWKAGKGLFTIF